MHKAIRRFKVLVDHKKYNKFQNKLLIDGKWVNSASGETFASINPFSEKEITSLQKAGAEDVNRAVKAARKAFDEGPWPRMDAVERGRIMFRLADLMEKHAEELAVLESLDNGKPYKDARNIDVPMAIAVIRYYAGWCEKIHGATIPMVGPYFTYTREEPVGVAAGIYAWNFPLALATWKLGPALATGNVMILKPAEQTPLTALKLGELAMEAGLPHGVLNILTGFGDVGQALVKHRGVDKISFTGSTEVGREILASNGTPNIKRMTMELGGKSANIILNDADVDLAVKQSQVGLFFNQGQCCIAGSRLFVQSKIYDEFIARTTEETKKRKLGDPFHQDTHQGPQVDKSQQERIQGYIDKGIYEGAKVLIGGKQYHGGGYFVHPTIFSDVKDEMTIAKEEIFGPVMSILKFDTIDEVLHRANSSQYGLGAGIVGKNMSDIFKLVKGLRAGSVYVNCYDVFQQTTPFGGFKDSGVGRELGEAGLRAYLETKTVTFHE
jgi:aldehyde dehydrogenase (NAD+)